MFAASCVLATMISTCFIFYLILGLALVHPSEQVSTECCTPPLKWDTKSQCSDGSAIAIKNCSIFYIIDPTKDESDTFEIDNNSLSLIITNENHIVSPEKFCTITNGSNRIALICYENEENNIVEYKSWKHIMLGIGFITSAIFVIVTLIIYACLPELRDIQDKSTINAMISLTAVSLMLSLLNFSPYVESKEYCAPIGFLLYFVALSYFFWMNIISFNIWRIVWFNNVEVADNVLFAIYSLIGWGFPTCFLIAALTFQHIEGDYLKPNIGEMSCWFPGLKQTWAYFYWPMAAILIINIIFVSMIIWKLWREYKGQSGCKMQSLKSNCLLYIKLIFITGITWIFEILSAVDGWQNNPLWILTDILNLLQGLIIFILLVVTRPKVKILLARKRPCGIAFPKSWTAQLDQEYDNACAEVELSQS